MKRRKEKREAGRFDGISALLFGKMKVLRYTLDDVIVRMPEAISRNTLCLKLRSPEKFRLGELLQVCDILGIEFEELSGCF